MSVRYLIAVQYDGTDFCGWQRQKNGVSVQEVLEKAIFAALHVSAVVTGSGRTDAGVHAARQVCHFDAEGLTIPPEKIKDAVNPFLPPAVKILSCKPAPQGFHARFSAKEKTYEYTYLFSATDLPLYSRYATHVNVKVDINGMQKAAKDLIGTHDFSAFCASGSSVKDTVRTLTAAEICYTPFSEQEGEGLLKIRVTGNGFLYNMVRIIAGTLLEIGQGKRQKTAFTDAIKTGNRKMLGKTAPAKGLTLLRVCYE